MKENHPSQAFERASRRIVLLGMGAASVGATLLGLVFHSWDGAVLAGAGGLLLFAAGLFLIWTSWRTLAAAYQESQRQGRAKKDFSANLFHELRTSLTLILTPVEERLAQEGGQERDLLRSIQGNSYRLLRLLDDLLDLTRIDARQLRLRIGPIDLHQLCRGAVEAFRPAAAAQRVDLILGGQPVANVFGDPHRLEIVLTNLISNALKATPAGGTVRVAIEGDEESASISISDAGPGVRSEEKDRIFERFYRADDHGNGTQGLGIGLALAKELCELHGGNLEVESPPGAGASFTMKLRLGEDHFRPEVRERRILATVVRGGRRMTDVQAAGNLLVSTPSFANGATNLAPLLFEGGRKPRIVLVEDDEAILALIQGILSLDFEVEPARNGVEGLEKVRRLQPDLLISDVRLPKLNGTELCSIVKADPAQENLPVILLTAQTGSEAVLDGYAHGADDFVTKPIHPRVLLARIHAQLRIRALGLKLVEHARLAAVGTLAAGVGHEVRNPLNAVLNGASSLLRKKELDPSSRRVLEVIEEAGNRIEKISAALVDHVHPGEHGAQRLVDVREGLDTTLCLLEHRFRDVAVHRLYSSSQLVLAAAGELNQVFFNLIDNAIRAASGNIWIRMADREKRVLITVEDDGPGVSVDTVHRLFDPFFTTKEPGEGTGLGLYLSRRLVGKHGGTLHYERRLGGGSSFVVDLPSEGHA